MNYGWELIIDIMDTLLFCILVNGKLEKKNISHNFIKQIIACSFISLTLWLLNIYNISPMIILLIILVIFHYIYILLFFSTSPIISLLWVIIYATITIFSEALATIIPTRVFHLDLSHELVGGSLRIPFTLLYIVLIATFVLCLLCFSTKTFHLTTLEKIVFIFLALLCITIENLIVVGQTKSYENDIHSFLNTLYVIFFLVLLLFIALTIYVYLLGIEREKYTQLSNRHIMSEMEKKQYDQIISSISELRFLKHDINNHLDTLNSMICHHKYTDAEKYIHNLSNTMNSIKYIIASGNTTIDSIITNKLIQCRAGEITVNHSIFLPDSIPLSNVDLCSLLGNLFDNAIEACMRISNKEKRIITFSIKPYRDMFSLYICNHTDGIYKTKGNHLLSRKSEIFDCSHGLGISRIQTIVHKYNGIINIESKDNFFSVSILLPLSESKEN